MTQPTNENHVDRMLELAETYEKAGNKKMSDYWIDKADKFDKRMKTKGDYNA